MAWPELSAEKKSVVIVFIFVFVSFSLLGLVLERRVPLVQPLGDVFKGDLAVQYNPLSQGSSAPARLNAKVLGSIYETGSNMTVFGACFDGDGYLLPTATANFTAWFPNGTVMLGPNVSMTPVLNESGGPSGRFRIHVVMGDTIGTYLTEMRCSFAGDYAFAYGEWQNPEWVKRIRETQDAVANLSLVFNNVSSTLDSIQDNISQLRNDSSANFSQVLNLLDSLNVSVMGGVGSSERSIDELYRLGHVLNPSVWVVDEKNPTFSLASGVNNWVAVDMVNKHDVQVVADDGKALSWDGEVWTYYNVSGVQFFGVSAVDAAQLYGWFVGKNVSNNDCVISINGAAPFAGPSASGQYCFDVKVFRKPNDPTSLMDVYLMDSGGNIWLSTDNGASYANAHSGLLTGVHARISQIIENRDLGVTSGYRVGFVTDAGSFVYYDGSGYTQYDNVTNAYEDVSLLYDNLGYVVGTDSVDGMNKVWKFENGTISEVYKWSGASAVPVGIAAASTRDIWVVTKDPGFFYHFDGEKWQYASFAFSSFASIILNFGNVTNVTGLRDVTLFDAKTAYAVGSDGLVMRLESDMDSRFDEVLSSVSSELVSLNDSIQLKLDEVNASTQMGVSEILSNVTFTQLYLETTLTPLVNATYQNTLLILQQLGLLGSQINETIALQNQTLGIVNQTAMNVDELLNRSRKVRAWTTQ